MATFPTKRAEWSSVNDRVISAGGMLGTVIRIANNRSLPVATVRWDNGYTGRISITLIRTTPRPND